MFFLPRANKFGRCAKVLLSELAKIQILAICVLPQDAIELGT